MLTRREEERGESLAMHLALEIAMREAIFFGQIQAFVEVANLGSLTEAAASLYLSQPAITSRLNRLEQELGATLIDRSRGKSARLSEAGKAFLPYAQQIMTLLNDGERTVVDVKQAASKDLLISATPNLSSYFLPVVVKRFQMRHQEGRIHIRSELSQDVLQSVHRGDVNIGLGRSLPHPEIECIPLFEEEWEFAVGAIHPLAHKAEVTIADLAGQVLIHDGPSASYLEFWGRLFKSGEIRLQRSIEIDNNETAKGLMAQGIGIGLLPKTGSVKEFADGSLCRIAVKGIAPMRRQMAAMRLRNSVQSALAREFLALVKVHVDEMGLRESASEARPRSIEARSR